MPVLDLTQDLFASGALGQVAPWELEIPCGAGAGELEDRGAGWELKIRASVKIKYNNNTFPFYNNYTPFCNKSQVLFCIFFKFLGEHMFGFLVQKKDANFIQHLLYRQLRK